MTYAANETSAYSGRPIELYRFYDRARAWTFTSSEQVVQYNGETYQPSVLQRSAPEQSQERRQSRLTIVCSRDFEVAKLFRLFIPASTVWLTIYRTFRGSSSALPYWTGRVRAVVQRGSQAEIQADPIDALLKRNGLRGRYQASCNHILYGPDCGVRSGDYQLTGSVVSVEGNLIVVGAAGSKPDGWFTNGLCERPETADYRMITAHTADQLVLTIPFEDLGLGETLLLYAGCDRTVATCKAKFDNLVNYGGFPMIPARNPYAGSLNG
jgi:uncharacterized phage protein (TIGR02218 family)